MLETMVLKDINEKYKKGDKNLTKSLVEKYIKDIELHNDNKIYVTYKD